MLIEPIHIFSSFLILLGFQLLWYCAAVDFSRLLPASVLHSYSQDWSLKVVENSYIFPIQSMVRHLLWAKAAIVFVTEIPTGSIHHFWSHSCLMFVIFGWEKFPHLVFHRILSKYIDMLHVYFTLQMVILIIWNIIE